MKAGGGKSPGASLRGDESALYRDLQPRLLGLLRSRIRGPGQTLEDACSFAWVQLVRHQPDRASVLGWLYVVACREAWHMLEREARTPPLPGDQLEPYAGADPAAAARGAMRETRVALAALPERQRRLLFLHAAGYSHAELAAIDRASVRTIRRRLSGARSVVREGREATFGDSTP